MNGRLLNKAKPAHWAAAAAFVFGLFVHMFGLVNIMHNYDNISTPIGFAVGITSGRWFLEFLGKIVAKFLVGGYNLSWFNGVVFLMVLSAAAWFLVDVLELRSRISAVAVGMALVSFPTAAATLFFRYTSVCYGIAVLFAVLAAWVLKNWKYGLIPSALLTACGLGIYQAHMPVTVAIFVLLLLRQTLEGKEKVSKLFLRGVYFCASIVIGLVVYFVMMKLTVAQSSEALDTYQGLDQMGKVALKDIPMLVANAFLTFFTAPRAEYDLIQNTFMSLLYVLLLAVSIALIGYILITRIKKLDAVLFTVFLCAVFPIAVNLITIMSPSAGIYTLMTYSFVLVLVLPLVAFDVLAAEKREKLRLTGLCRKAVLATLAAILFCNTYYTNLNYQIQYYTTKQVENYAVSLVTQVRMTEGFDTEKKWAFLGKPRDPLLDTYWSELNRWFAYGGNTTSAQLLRNYSWESWIPSYVGYTVPAAEDEEKDSLRQLEEVKEMPSWPDQGSIKVIGEYIVVKFEK